MKKFTALLLATIMVALCFSVMVSAADENLALGKSYTIVATDETPLFADGGKGYFWSPCVDTDPGTLLTDGEVRAAGALVAGGAGQPKKTIELAGTYREGLITIDLENAASVSSVVVRNARRGGNRYTNIAKVELATGDTFTEVQFTETKETVADSAQYGAEGQDPKDQFFNLTLSFTATNARYVRLTINTEFPEGTTEYNVEGVRGYIAQLDEIEVYGAAASTDTPDDTTSEENNDEPATSESEADSESEAPVPSQDTTPDTDTPETGDAGIAVFAVLAVVSLAGVVISKKSK